MPRPSARGASERLPQAEVDLKGLIIGAVMLGRYGNIESDGTDGRVVSDPCPDPDVERAWHHLEFVADLTAVDEERGTKMLAEALAIFQTAGGDRGAAEGIVRVRNKRACRLVGIAAKGAAAAAVEALIRRQTVLCGALREA